MVTEGLAFLAQLVLCFRFFNSRGWSWALWLGWAVLAAAMLLGGRARLAFQSLAQTADEEHWYPPKAVVDDDVYGLVRHPMYLSFMGMSLSLVLLSQDGLCAVLGTVVVAMLYNDMHREEESSLAKFGDAYRRYMLQVPRMNLLVGLFRMCRKRPSSGETRARPGERTSER
jgi:protein-S-isoprenylcysteine O-methyltransferase Ste14